MVSTSGSDVVAGDGEAAEKAPHRNAAPDGVGSVRTGIGRLATSCCAQAIVSLKIQHSYARTKVHEMPGMPYYDNLSETGAQGRFLVL